MRHAVYSIRVYWLIVFLFYDIIFSAPKKKNIQDNFLKITCLASTWDHLWCNNKKNCTLRIGNIDTLVAHPFCSWSNWYILQYKTINMVSGEKKTTHETHKDQFDVTKCRLYLLKKNHLYLYQWNSLNVEARTVTSIIYFANICLM